MITIQEWFLRWFPEIGVPPVIIHFHGIFHSKPTIFGYLHDYENPLFLVESITLNCGSNPPGHCPDYVSILFFVEYYPPLPIYSPFLPIINHHYPYIWNILWLVLAGVGKCPNVSHHPTFGDIISNRYLKVM